MNGMIFYLLHKRWNLDLIKYVRLNGYDFIIVNDSKKYKVILESICLTFKNETPLNLSEKVPINGLKKLRVLV